MDEYKKRLAEVEDESANIIMRLQAELIKEREANAYLLESLAFYQERNEPNEG